MRLINSILNLCGLLLWLNWLSSRFDPLARIPANTLIGALRKADPSGPRGWVSLAGLLLLLLGRAIFYQALGPAVWTPRLPLPPIEVAFRSDSFLNMMVFSALSMLLTLGAFYSSLLLLSLLNRQAPESDPVQKLVRLYFKWFERWPRALKLLLPFIVGGLSWAALQPLLVRLGNSPATKTPAQLAEQAAIIGLGSYLTWQYVILGTLAFHIVTSYVYVGEQPFWNFVTLTARNLLRPLRRLPLRIGRVDLLPALVLALVLIVLDFPSIADHFSRPKGGFRSWFYLHLPFN